MDVKLKRLADEIVRWNKYSLLKTSLPITDSKLEKVLRTSTLYPRMARLDHSTREKIVNYINSKLMPNPCAEIEFHHNEEVRLQGSKSTKKLCGEPTLESLKTDYAELESRTLAMSIDSNFRLSAIMHPDEIVCREPYPFTTPVQPTNKTRPKENKMPVTHTTYVNGQDINIMTEGQLVDARNLEIDNAKAKKVRIEELQSKIAAYKNEIAKHNESAKELKAIITERQGK